MTEMLKRRLSGAETKAVIKLFSKEKLTLSLVAECWLRDEQRVINSIRHVVEVLRL